MQKKEEGIKLTPVTTVPFHNLLFQNMRSMVDNKMIIVFLIVIILDIFTGYAKSFLATDTMAKTQSAKGLNGLIKHGLVILIILVLYPLMTAMGYESYADIVVAFYILNYSISISENLGQTGIPIPSWLKNRLAKLQKDYDHSDDKEDK